MSYFVIQEHFKKFSAFYMCMNLFNFWLLLKTKKNFLDPHILLNNMKD